MLFTIVSSSHSRIRLLNSGLYSSGLYFCLYLSNSECFMFSGGKKKTIVSAKRDVFESRICWPGVFSSNINRSGKFCNKLIKVYQMYINLFLIFIPCCRVLPLPKRMRIRTLRHFCLHPVNGSIYFLILFSVDMSCFLCCVCHCQRCG